MMIRARRLTVTGRVQGVGFRFHVARAARAEGIGGWVRNRSDGAVEAWLEGRPEAVARVERAVRQGPPPARVVSVAVTEEPPAGRPAGFHILPDG